VADPAASDDPPEQLKGFRRVTLKPGQTATVSFPLTIHDLASWSAGSAWKAQAGTYSVKVGDASDHLPLAAATSLARTLTGQVAAGAAGAGVSLANTAVSANVTPNSGVPGAETVGVVNPYGYSSPKGAAVSFAVQAVDSNASQALAFTATGLPPGIKMASNGTISGVGGKLGTWTVTVTATDREGVSGSATFVWSVVRLPRPTREGYGTRMSSSPCRTLIQPSGCAAHARQAAAIASMSSCVPSPLVRSCSVIAEPAMRSAHMPPQASREAGSA
jgi:beta-glucosidase